MPKIDMNKRKWENRHKTFNDPIKNMYTLFNGAGDAVDTYNKVTSEIMALIKKATEDKTTLRALGAGWSWHQIMTGGPKGIILDTKPLNTIFPISQARVLPSYTKEVNKLKFVQCGAGIWELNEALKPINLSLKTTGASNGQTIAGLIGTGAHGSAIDIGSAQDFVVGLHIVVSSTRHVYIERDSYQVVNQSFVDKFGAELIRNDEIFNAALVSFGCFGFVHGVMVEVDDIFLIEGSMRMDDFDNDVLKLMQTNDFTNTGTVNVAEPNTRPYHFEVKLNPYDSLQQVYITTMYKKPFHTNYMPPNPNSEGIGPGDDAPAFIGKVLETVPSLIPKAINTLTKSSLTLYEKATGSIGEIFNNTLLRGKLLSAAIAIPIDRIKEVIAVLAEVNAIPSVKNFPGIYAFRFVKGTKATLGFTKFNQTCVVEMDGAYSDRSIEYCKKVWDKLEEKNIPFACHWGKQTDLSPSRIQYMYGQAAVDSWKAARNSLLDADSKKVFTNPIMEKWGLD
ncbi:MAG: FAD-binding protein [Bacteroidota bacterium]